MKISIFKYLIITIILFFAVKIQSQNIQRFEYYNSKNGLSQNTVYSMMCDTKGFLWMGTMNGLNRYDGMTFKVFRGSMGDIDASSNNNRIERIWEDKAHFIWIELYDGCYQCFDQRKEIFTTFPEQNGEIVEPATSFLQYSNEKIFVGTDKSVVYMLTFNVNTKSYDISKFNVSQDNQPAIITALYADKEQTLWILTNLGLAKISKEQIDNSDLSPQYFFSKTSFTKAITETNGQILFGTKNEGLLIYNIREQEYTYFAEPQFNKCGVENLITLPDGQVIAATTDAHLYILPPTINESTEIDYHTKGIANVERFYLDKYRQLWVVTSKPGLTRYNTTSGKSYFYKLIPTELSVSVDLERPCFCEDNNNNLWLGLHGGGLLWYNRITDKFEFYRNKMNDVNSIPSNIVHCIVEDHSGQIWLGTGQYRGGLVKIIVENRAFHTEIPNQQAKSQMDNVVRALYEDDAHNLWVSTKSGLLYVYDELGRKIRTFDGFQCDDGSIKHSVAYCITTDSNGYLWIATKGAGVCVSEKPVNFKHIETEQIRFVNYNQNGDEHLLGVSTKLCNDNAYCIAEDGFGNMWIATYGGGLSRIKRNNNGVEISNFDKNNSNIISNKVRYLIIDSNKDLWIATTNGVCRADANSLNTDNIIFEHIIHTNNNNSLSYNDVCYIYEDCKGNKYFATIGGGLNVLHYDDKTPIYDMYDTSNGLCNNAIYGIVEDNGGNIWLTTENGISRMDIESKTFESFNDNTGLIFNSFSESTCTKLFNGKLAFGGYMGYVVVSPLQLSSSPYKGELVLTSLNVANNEIQVSDDTPLKESITFSDAIELDYNQSNISITYRTLDFLAPDNIRYAYILEGLEDDWNYVGNQTKATYTNLQPGSYILRVKNTYRNGQWSNVTRDLKIIINAPWWRTIAAYIFYVVFAICFIYVIMSAIKRVKSYQEQLQVEKKVNEVKLQFFTNIAHEIRTPLTLIVSPIETLIKENLPKSAHEQILIIKRNSNRILLLINQLLDFRKVQNKKMYLKISQIDIGEIAQQVGNSFKLLAEQKGINYNINIQENTNPIWVDVTEMDTIIYNLLSNAMKFTDSGKSVSLNVKQDDDFTYIEVIDEGRGIADTSPEVLFKRYTILSTTNLSGTGIGLSLSYELVQLHKGEIIVNSTIGKGSSFIVKLRNGRKHFEGDQMITFNDDEKVSRFAVMPNNPIELQPEEVEVASQRKSILIVEDNVEILNYLAQSLHGKYDCLKATNGQEALLLIREKMPDIILTDIMMPVMDGLELIKQIRGDFATCHLPIIVLTAKSTIEDQIETYQLGIDAYVPKPFNLDYLKTIIENVIQRREILISEIIGLKTMSAVEIHDKNKAENQELNLQIMSRDEEFIKEIVRYTEETYRSNLSIDDIASNFHMSRTVFYNKVKGLTGQSPLEFIRCIKFKIAEQLLNKGFNVSEVAFEIGYSDVKYFSKQFRAQFGYAPSVVRKALKNENIEHDNDDNVDDSENIDNE